MNITNLLRDQIHLAPEQASFGFSTPRGRSGTINLRSTGIVYTDVGSLNTLYRGSNVSSSDWSATGLFMQQPRVDSSPYRVIANIFASAGTAFLIIGDAPEVITGVDDVITNVKGIPIVTGIDTVIRVKAYEKGNPLQDRALAFGIAVTAVTGNDVIDVNLSVQNMAVPSPQFSSSMS